MPPAPSYITSYATSRALVIGIDSYQRCSPLSGAANDARAIAELLKSQFAFMDEHVTLLVDYSATKEKILLAFHAFANGTSTDPNDRLIVFFAGHGHTVPGHRGATGFLVPVDGSIDDIASLIRWDELTRGAELISAKHILFIMDACYGGLALNRKTIPAGSRRYINDMLTRYSRQVLTAGKADEPVSDGHGTRPGHSIFTSHVLDGLEGAAAVEPGIVTATGLMYYVQQRVGTDALSRQTPHFGHIDGDGEFIFSGFDIPVSSPEGSVAPPVKLSPDSAAVPEVSVAERMKELLSEQGRQIELSDFVNRHIRAASERLSPTHFPENDPGDIADRLRKYEVAVEDLQTIVVLLAHWAEPRHLPLLERIFARLVDLQTSRGGLQLWINLSWYPLLYLIYSAGIAAVASERYAALNKVLYATVYPPEGRRRSEAVPVMLPVVEYLTEIHDAFKKVPGYERKYTPRSEYLHTRLQPLLEDLLFLGLSYENLFDQFEVFLALSYGHYLQQTQQRVWGPPGRFAWKYSSRGANGSPFNTLRQGANATGAAWPPLLGGLFGGDSTQFDQVAGEYEKSILTKLNWY